MKYFNIGIVGLPDWANETCPRKAAIGYCMKELKFYEDWGRHNRIHWKIWQNTAIISGALATILAALPSSFFYDSQFIAGIMRVIPTALSAVSATVLGVYNYKGEHIRQGAAHDSLQGELCKFVSSAEPYDNVSESKNISQFVLNMRAIIGGELAGWRRQFQPEEQPAPPKPNSSPVSSEPVK
jgi:hypothetical protein